MPAPREDNVLDYSRWQQMLIGVSNFDIIYYSNARQMGMYYHIYLI